jgi:hypothetical protein
MPLVLPVSITAHVLYNQSKVSTTSGLRAYPVNVAVSCQQCKDEGLAGNGSASRSTSARASGAAFDLGKELDSPQGVFLSSLFPFCREKMILKSKIKSASEKSIACGFATSTDGT